MTHQFIPIVIPPELHSCFSLWTLQNHNIFRREFGNFQCFVYQWFVFNDFGEFNSTTSCHQYFGLGIINPYRKLIGSKTAENHRVDRTQSGTSKHCNHCFGNHGHVNNDTVSLFHTQITQASGEFSNGISQLCISKFLLHICYWRIINQCQLVTASLLNVNIECKVGCVKLSTGKPAVKSMFVLRQDCFRKFIPLYLFSLFSPENFRLFYRLLIFIMIIHGILVLENG